MKTSTVRRAVITAMCGLAMAMSTAVRCPADAPPRLRIVTYNIHIGRGSDGKINLPRVADVLTQLSPDVVALQEVDRGTRRCGGVDQAAELGRLTGMHATFGKAMDYDGGEYGEAVLSRRAPSAVINHALPHSRGHEPRAALAVTLPAVDGLPEIRVIGTHLDHVADPQDRMLQAKKINELFGHAPTPLTILAGDLNAAPTSKPMVHLAEHWTLTHRPEAPGTWPADRPRIRIDHVLYRNGQPWRAVESRVVDERVASDHRPLLVVLQYTGDPTAERGADTPKFRE